MKNFIKRFLEQKGITQKEVAEAIGMTEAGLSKAIKGSATKDTVTTQHPYRKLLVNKA